MVLNDEAHHTHAEDGEWTRVVRTLHGRTPLNLQVDLSATPRYPNGALFPWTIFDYPLKQALLDGVVKRPMRGVLDVQEVKSERARSATRATSSLPSRGGRSTSSSSARLGRSLFCS